MRTTTLALLTAIWCLSSAPAQSQETTDTLRTYWTSGLRLNQGHLVGMLGVTRQISSRILVYAGGDFGGHEYALTGTTMIRITDPKRFTLYGVLGPQAETVAPNPTHDQVVTYLTAATGILATYDIQQDFTTWLGVTYLITGADIRQWKIGAGIALPLEL
jgi:hypothetical protein